jgi:hypothetical protein
LFSFINPLELICTETTFVSQLELLLPDLFLELAEAADSLPGNEQLAAHPFTGFVLNFNGATRIHRDWDDQDICVVIISSDCKGGSLVFKELGLVLDLQNGDMVTFRSSKLSHFNLHFKGLRTSLVLHSDQSMDSWVKNRNNWEQNKFFISSRV